MRVLQRRFVAGALSCVVLTLPSMLPRALSAQVSSFQACSQGTLANCASIRLTSTLGAGAGGTNLFEISINNLGSTSNTALPTSIYFMTLLTGKPAAAPGTEVDVLASPVASGGATISDASPWSIFEDGEAIFLSALGNNGIGGCATSGAVDGFGQMGRTCGANNFISFSFSTTRAFTPAQFSLSDLEIVAIAPGNSGDSCNDVTPCTTPRIVTPEPSSLALMMAGIAMVAVAGARRRTALRKITIIREA